MNTSHNTALMATPFILQLIPLQNHILTNDKNGNKQMNKLIYSCYSWETDSKREQIIGSSIQNQLFLGTYPFIETRLWGLNLSLANCNLFLWVILDLSSFGRKDVWKHTRTVYEWKGWSTNWYWEMNGMFIDAEWCPAHIPPSPSVPEQTSHVSPQSTWRPSSVTDCSREEVSRSWHLPSLKHHSTTNGRAGGNCPASWSLEWTAHRHVLYCPLEFLIGAEVQLLITVTYALSYPVLTLSFPFSLPQLCNQNFLDSSFT